MGRRFVCLTPLAVDRARIESSTRSIECAIECIVDRVYIKKKIEQWSKRAAFVEPSTRSREEPQKI